MEYDKIEKTVQQIISNGVILINLNSAQTSPSE